MIARSIAKAGMQSASIMTIADITTQLLVERRVFTLQKKIGKEKEDDDHEFDQATISGGKFLAAPFIREILRGSERFLAAARFAARFLADPRDF